jgi:L-ectoine synthase
MLLNDDKMGFSFHITTIYADTETPMHYQQHLESVYCMAGTGEIKDLATGQVHAISPGTLYILDKHDKHILYAHTELSLACVFNPPLTGQEVHNKEGSYPLATAS